MAINTNATRGTRSDPLHDGCRLTPEDARLFHLGRHFQLFDVLGAHPTRVKDEPGVAFAVWAPGARRVSVIGSFNGWNRDSHPLQQVPGSGVWSGFFGAIEKGSLYKYHIESRARGGRLDKADPFAICTETPPSTASVVWDLDYEWGDAEWMAERGKRSALDAPMSIYELHLGSWRRHPDDPERKLSYRELADELAEYVERMNFTHVELLPPLEHPFYGSWGYQITGYYAPTARYGRPQDLMYLIDRLHQRGIGVILDWVPSHFPSDNHGLGLFDGTRLYEYPDPKVGYQPEWKSYVFNYGCPEVKSFLISGAIFWLRHYHVDAIRVDAVASMLYLDYSREEGQWIQNKYGGRENLEAIAFLRQLNVTVHDQFPEVKVIAEESTAWPLVSKPVHLGGLGFDMKWDMGWMHDTLRYMSLDPISRKYEHDSLTFRMMYAFSENFVLPLSHDEVVHGKSSLLGKMPGDEWQHFANLRVLLGYMYGQPGKKLLFMGGEFGQWSEWDHDRALEWEVLQYAFHSGLQRWVQDLNALYRETPALHERDFDQRGFNWIDCQDADNSVIAFTRHGREEHARILVVCNFTPVPRHDYRVGVPADGVWRERLNGDAEEYGGSGQGNLGAVTADAIGHHGLPYSLALTLPPLAVLFLERE